MEYLQRSTEDGLILEAIATPCRALSTKGAESVSDGFLISTGSIWSWSREPAEA